MKRLAPYIEERFLEGINEYLLNFTIGELLEGTDAVVFGGALRDSYHEDPINDLDILCFGRGRNKIFNFLGDRGFEQVEGDEDAQEEYWDFRLFSNPILLEKGDCKVHVINLYSHHPLTNCNGKGDMDHREAIYRVASNVDIDICGFLYSEISGLCETVEFAFDNLDGGLFSTKPDAVMHREGRMEHRIKKMESKGYKNISTN